MKRFLTSWWVIATTVALLAALLLCWGLPIFVGFLRPWWVRLIVFLTIAGVYGLLAWLRIRKARKASDAIAEELARSDADGETRVLSDRMAEALKTLRTATGRKRSDYLYSRPWYVIIGPPGAGKTTALVNSGLRFPYSNEAFKGVGGTRNLDFMFADEAVLVDTAGRYTSQDSDAGNDARGWDGFLGLLRKHRPLQPINGVIVAIGVDELMRGDRRSIDQHATTVRRRLAELRKTLEINVPVYVLATKADLISGFTEFYDDLDVEGRRAVLGQTLAFSEARPDPDVLAEAFDAVAQSAEARQAMRLASEPDAPRRALILGFPAQLGLLRSRMLRFLEGVFVAGDTPIGTLRGFYLTSGVQEGTPLDRIVSGMADVYDQPRSAASGGGKAYFLNRLLTEVVFREAGLVQLDPRARKRQRAQLTGALVGVAAVSLLVFALWMVSFFQNRGFQHDLLAKANAAQQIERETGVDLVEVRDSDPGLDQMLDLLRAARTLPQGYATAKAGGPPLSMTFGLYQSSLAGQAQESYRKTLRRILLPRIMLQLEQNMRANLSSPLAVYEPLKVYLMLGGQGPMNKGAVKGWVTTLWANETYPGPDAAAMRGELAQHLDSLLDDPDMAVEWQARRAPLDGDLVAAARAAVQNLSLAERAYAILRQKASASSGAPWAASAVLASGDATAFANGEAVLAAQVPFFFTRAGYEKAYQPGLATVQNDLKNDLWVFGGDADTTAIREQLGQVRGGVAGLYAKDYIAAWDKIIALMQPRDYFRDLPALAAITRTPSPLKLVLLELRKNTTFGGGSRAAGTMLQEKIDEKLGRLSQLQAPSTGVDAGREIENYFKVTQEYVGDGKAPGPIDDFLTALRNAATALQTARATGGGLGGEAVQSQMNAAMAAVGVSAASAPPQLQPFVSALSKGGAQQGAEAATGAVSDVYAQTVLPACKGAAQDRYPFFSGSANDVSVVDLQRVFGLGGTIDSFAQQRLSALLDTSGPVWRWKEGDPVAAALDPASPDSFAKAAEIRDLVAGGLVLRVALESVTGAVDTVQFSAGDANFAFTPADKSVKQLRWSAQGGSPSASVVLMQGGKAVRTFSEEGIWALFRLMDTAKRENAGPTTFLATFGDGTGAATLRIGLPSDRNPFSRGGVWTFRCPIAL